MMWGDPKENQFDKCASTFGMELAPLEKIIGVKNIRSLPEKNILDALRNKLSDANQLRITRAQEAGTVAEDQILQKSNLVREENIFLREQNFKLKRQMDAIENEMMSIKEQTKTTQKRLNQLDNRRIHLIEELKFLRSKKQQTMTKVISNKVATAVVAEDEDRDSKLIRQTVSNPDAPRREALFVSKLSRFDSEMKKTPRIDEGQMASQTHQDTFGKEYMKVFEDQEQQLVDLFGVRRITLPNRTTSPSKRR